MTQVIMLVLIWFDAAPVSPAPQITTPALVFPDYESCVAAIEWAEGRVKVLNPRAHVSATCYHEDPRG